MTTPAARWPAARTQMGRGIVRDRGSAGAARRSQRSTPAQTCALRPARAQQTQAVPGLVPSQGPAQGPHPPGQPGPRRPAPCCASKADMFCKRRQLTTDSRCRNRGALAGRGPVGDRRPQPVRRGPTHSENKRFPQPPDLCVLFSPIGERVGSPVTPPRRETLLQARFPWAGRAPMAGGWE